MVIHFFTKQIIPDKFVCHFGKIEITYFSSRIERRICQLNLMRTENLTYKGDIRIS